MMVIVECTTMFKISRDRQASHNIHNSGAERELISREGEPVHS